MRNLEESRIAIIGLGYVGLPLAVEFGRHYDTLGFDINQARIDELRAGHDQTLEVDAAELAAARACASRPRWTTCARATSTSSPCPRRSTTPSGPT